MAIHVGGQGPGHLCRKTQSAASLPAMTMDSSTGVVTTLAYTGAPEGLFSGALSAKYLAAPTTGYLTQQNQLFRTQTETTFLNLPDATGGDTGKGFTCTGIAIDASGNYIIGNDGGAKEGDGLAHTCGIVKVSPAGLNLGEINVRALYGFASTATVQGIAIDPADGSYWIGCAGSGVKHLTPGGVALSGAFTPASGNANGIAIDTLRGRILVFGFVSGLSTQLDIYDLATQAPISTGNMIANTVNGDHLFYDAARDYIWCTYGPNAASNNGAVCIKASDLSVVGTVIFPTAQAIEGIAIKNGQFIVCHDGYYHSFSSGALPATNQLQFYPAVQGFANVAWPVEYDALTHALLGYRIEPAFARLSDNPITQGNVAWTKSGTTVTALTQVSPTGATDANTVTATAGTAVHELSRGAASSVLAGDKVITHDMVKMGTQRYLWFGDRGDTGVVHSATFDLQLGTVVGSSNCTASIKDLGNGWYRCTRAFTRTNAGAPGGNIAFPSGSTHAIDRPSWTALGTETFHIYAHEIALGEYSTSPTFASSSTETRAADTATLATSALGLSATVNTFILQGRTARGVSATTSQVMFQIDDGSESNRIRLVRDTAKALRFIVTVGGVQQCNLNLGTVNDETDFKVAIRCKAADFSASLNGGAVVTAATGTLPTVTTFRLGASFTGEQWAGWVKSFTIKASGDADATLITEST